MWSNSPVFNSDRGHDSSDYDLMSTVVTNVRAMRCDTYPQSDGIDHSALLHLHARFLTSNRSNVPCVAFFCDTNAKPRALFTAIRNAIRTPCCDIHYF